MEYGSGTHKSGVPKTKIIPLQVKIDVNNIYIYIQIFFNLILKRDIVVRVLR